MRAVLHFVTNGPLCGCTVLQSRPHNINTQTLVMRGRWDHTYRSLWLSETHWLNICSGFWPVRRAISWNDDLYIDRQPYSLLFWPLLANIFSYYSRHKTIFWANADLIKPFPNEISAIQLFFYAVLQMSLLSRTSSTCAEIVIICIFQPLLSFMWFWCSSDHSFLLLQF